ncbi:glutathione S-transferase [Gautieria morchelliformis]|nr:glutathione S-transferase [Gautieria morchelliformis]
MVLKLYGASNSTCTRRVATVFHEKKVPFEFIEVDVLKGASKTPEYLARQPFGQIPCLDDDGFILFESRAICRYIEAKFPNQGSTLVPTEAKAKALFEQAASIESSNFEVYALPAVFEKVFKPYFNLTPDQATFDALIAKLDAKLQAYDTILGKQKYLAGNELTMADLFHLPLGTLVGFAGSDVMTSKPNVARWWKELQARPSWQAVQGDITGTA